MQDEPILSPGLRVETFDRRPVGTIEAMDKDRILLRRLLGRPFWMDQGLVQSVEGNRVTLFISGRVVNRYRQPYESGAGLSRRSGRLRYLPAPIACSALLAGVAFAVLGGV